MALRWLFNSSFTHALVHTTGENKQGKNEQKLNGQTRENGVRSFQMPIHYPRYTKGDYEKMEEWKVEMLLRQYGLDHHVKGALNEKRMFAMGAFLWPDQL